MNAALKSATKFIAQRTLGLLPPSAARFSGALAIDGGIPVRSQRLRPWKTQYNNTLVAWSAVRRAFRDVFLRGVEGLPQPLAKKFARQWAEYCGCEYGLLLPHGTDALRIALAAVLDHDGLEYGGEVIVPNLSFIASATAALDRRFGVVFVDVEPGTLLIDPRRVEEAIIPGKTRAIMPVHLFGQPADMTSLREISKRHGLKIIEDAAQAHGAAWEMGPVGALGDAAGFSFQSSKNLACGEGGALTTNDEQVFERAYSMQDAGRTRIGGKRWGHVALGWNCRVTEYQAALLIQRFRNLRHQQDTRWRNFSKLRELLDDVPCVEPLAVHPGVRKHGTHMFVMRYRPEHCGSLSLQDFLNAVGAEGAPIYRAYAATMANQPAMQTLMVKHPDYFRLLPTPVAEQAAKEIVYISQNVFLGTEADMADIAAALRKVQKYYAPGAVRATSQSDTEELKLADATAPTVEVSEKPRPLRCGIIGVGIMGQNHVEVVAKHKLVALAAITDADPQRRRVAQQMDCQWFDSPMRMIGSGVVDTVVIATPHWQHAELSVAALRAGLHVICEKPLSVTVSQADEVLRVAEECETLFVVVHQSRFEPTYQQAKRFLDSGELGPIMRCSMVETVWRSEAYYKSSPWRGTWKGEGGGVLLNQAPHVLDRYAWLCGMPERVSGRCDTSLHQIEVEDNASAVFLHTNGAHGHIHVSTNECPAVTRTVIACDKGRIVIENGAIRITRLRRSIREATDKDARYWGEIKSETRELGGGLVSSIPELLNLFYENVALAAAGKARLACPGHEGRNCVELANAITLSSGLGREVSFPLNRADYDQFIGAKIMGS